MSWNREIYTPSNKNVLDNLSDAGGILQYNGIPVSTGSNTYNITIQQAGTATPWNYYNALDNGVVGDGTTDDATAFNSLVSAVSGNGGGIIYAPKNTYYIGSSITWKSNVFLVGDGKELTIFKASPSCTNSVFYSVGNGETYNIGFSGFSVDGSDIDTSAGYNVKSKAFLFQQIQNAVFRDLLLRGTPASALGIDFLQDVIIDNVTTYDCGRAWTNNGSDQGGAGIGIGTGYLPIENLIIVNCKTYNSGHFGIFLEMQEIFGQGSENAKGVIIANCMTINGKNHGFGIRGGENITIANCQSYGNANYGYYLDYKLKKIKLTNNTASENTIGGFGVDGSAEITDLSIDNNISSNNGGDGISLFKENFASNKIVSNVIVANNQITNNAGADIFIGQKQDMSTIKIKNNISINNAKNSSKLYLQYTNSYAEIPYQVLESSSNQLTIMFKVGAFNKCIISRKNKDFKTSSNVEGFSISTTFSGAIKISGRKINDGSLYSYVYNEILSTATKYYLKINYTSSSLSVSYSTDGITYTQMTVNSSSSTGTDTDIISLLSSASLNYNIQIGREWLGSSGWSNYYQGLVIYNIKINDNLPPKESYEYRFFNVGFNKEIYEINDSGLNGTSGLGCTQMANEVV